MFGADHKGAFEFATEGMDGILSHVGRRRG
jgi:hypothetical protein